MNSLITKYRSAIYFVATLVIVTASFFTYSPLYNIDYNSDQAIPILMTEELHWPHDLYFWGQNRLGTFLQVCAWPFVHWFGLSSFYVVSFINFLFLFVTMHIVTSLLTSNKVKLIYWLLVFFPAHTYYTILLLAHPYNTQLFCTTLALFFLYKVYQAFLGRFHAFKIQLWLFGFFVFWACSFWVSELSVIFILLVFPFLWKDRFKIFQRIQEAFHSKKWVRLCVFLQPLVYTVVGLVVILYLKQFAPADPRYDRMFIIGHEVWAQLKFVGIRLSEGYSLTELSTSVYFNTSLLVTGLAIYFFRRMEAGEIKTFVIGAWFTAGVGFTLLFFSYWNFQSEFLPRYYTPIILLILLVNLLVLERYITRIVIALYVVMLIAGCSYTFQRDILLAPRESFLKKYKSISELGKCVVIGDYWICHRIASANSKYIYSFTHDRNFCRNYYRKEHVFKSEKIFLIRESFLDAFPEAMTQYGYDLIKVGDEFEMAGYHFCQYRVK